MKPRIPLVVAGVVVMIGGIALVLIGVVQLLAVMPAGDALTRITSGTAQEVVVGDDAGLVLYVDDDAPVSCAVTAPDGEPVQSNSRSSTTFTHEGREYRSLLPLGGESGASGTYTVACDGEAVVAPPMDVGALATVVVAIISGVLAIIGGVALVRFGLRLPLQKQWHVSWSAGHRRR